MSKQSHADIVPLSDEEYKRYGVERKSQNQERVVTPIIQKEEKKISPIPYIISGSVIFISVIVSAVILVKMKKGGIK